MLQEVDQKLEILFLVKLFSEKQIDVVSHLSLVFSDCYSLENFWKKFQF